MTTAEKTPRARREAAKDGWKGRRAHKATLPSGQEVTLRIPGLLELIRNEAVPTRLRDLAVAAAAHPMQMRGVMAEKLHEKKEGKERDDELARALEDVVEIQKHLIIECVLEPKLTYEDLDGLPEEDKELLGAIMMRETAYDARDIRLGIEPLDRWARFRHFHDCGPDCESCASMQVEFSGVDLG